MYFPLLQIYVDILPPMKYLTAPERIALTRHEPGHTTEDTGILFYQSCNSTNFPLNNFIYLIYTRP